MGLLGLTSLLDKPDPEVLNKGSIDMSKNANKSLSKPTPMLSYKVDWLAFTVPCKNLDFKITIKKFLDFWGYDLGLFEAIPGRYFYNSGYTIGYYFNIFYNDPAKEISKNSSMTVNFQLTGNGCTDLGYHLEELLDSKDYEANWLYLFEWLEKMNCKITRCDLALDDFTGCCSFETMIENHLKKGFYRSVKKTYSISRGADQKQNSRGLTIYVGKMPAGGAGSAGVVYARFYKKLDEFREKHQLAPKVARESGVWDRYEISFSKRKAQKVVDDILQAQSFSKIYLGVLRNLIEFVNPTRNQRGNLYRNKNKWEICDWWEKFLQNAEKVKIGSDASRETNLPETLQWLRVSVLPSLRLVEQVCLEHGWDFYSIIRQCDVEFAKKQKRLLKDSRHIPDKLLKLYLQQFKEGYK